MKKRTFEVGNLERVREPYLFREKEIRLQMRRCGGDDWVGCSCPTVRDERGEVIGLLTVCPPHMVEDSAGCMTARKTRPSFGGQVALVDALQAMVRQGWSQVEIADRHGERCVQLDLSALADTVRANELPGEVSVRALPASHLPRRHRIVIAAVTAPLLLFSGALALVPAFGALIPFGLLLVLAVALPLLPALKSAPRARSRAGARGFVTDVSTHAETDQAPAPKSAPPRRRAGPSSAPRPSSSGVFPAHSAHREAAEEEQPASRGPSRVA